MARRDYPSPQEKDYDNAKMAQTGAAIGLSSDKPYNQVDDLQRQLEKLKYELEERNKEVLHLYRRLHDRDSY